MSHRDIKHKTDEVPKGKKPKQTERTSLIHCAQLPALGEGCIWIPFFWADTFSQDNAKSVLSVLFQWPSAGGYVPVERHAIYEAGFYLVYICTSYWVRLLASVTQDSSAGSCDFHSSESGICFSCNVYWLPGLLKLSPLNLRCCVIHCWLFAGLLWIAGGNEVAVRMTFLTLYKVCSRLIQNVNVFGKVRCGAYV